MGDERRPDAAMVPRGLGGQGSPAQQQQRVNALIGPAIGATKFWYGDQGPQLFARPNRAKSVPTTPDIERDLAPSLLWPSGHPRHPEERYDWVFAEPGPDGVYRPTEEKADGFGDRPERVKFGYAKD